MSTSQIINIHKSFLVSAPSLRRCASESYPDIGVLMLPGKIQHIIESQHPGRNLSKIHRRVHMILHKQTHTHSFSNAGHHTRYNCDLMTCIVMAPRFTYRILSTRTEIRRASNWFHRTNLTSEAAGFRSGLAYPRWMTRATRALCKYNGGRHVLPQLACLLQTNLRFSNNARRLPLRMRAVRLSDWF